MSDVKMKVCTNPECRMEIPAYAEKCKYCDTRFERLPVASHEKKINGDIVMAQNSTRMSTAKHFFDLNLQTDEIEWHHIAYY